LPGDGIQGALAGAAAVVHPEVPPGPHPVVGEIGVAKIAVEQMKQGLQPLDAERGVPGCRGAEIVVHKESFWQSHAGWRHEPLADGGRRLIAKAGECERRSAGGSCSERCELRSGAIVERSIEICGVRPQSIDLSVIGVDDLAGLCVGVADRIGLDRLLELAIDSPEYDAGIVNRLQRVPRHDHFR
jgi:hypothetical protein